MSNLSLTIINTFDLAKIGFRDSSDYTGAVVGPNLVITPPDLFPINVPFVPNSDNVYSASDLNIDCDGVLPDGLYTTVYSIAPHDQNTVTQHFFRTSMLECKYQEALLSYTAQCNGFTAKDLNKILQVKVLMEAIHAATNLCDYTTATRFYHTATKLIGTLKM